MKLLKKLPCCLLIFVMCFPITALEAEFASYSPPVLDVAELLSESQERTIVAKINVLVETHGYEIGVILLDETAYYADFISEVKYNLAPSMFGNNRFILAMNLESREMLMEINGSARDKISDNQTDLFLDVIASDFTAGRYAEGIDQFLTLIDARLSGQVSQVEEDFLKQQAWEEKIPLLLMPLFMSLVIATATTIYFVQKMNNVRDQAGAVAYTNNAGFQMTHDREKFLYRNVVKSRRPQNNASGGGGRGGGGRSSGGRSRGF